jgi:hypothetical protein
LIPLAEIGTDLERVKTWTQAAADEANRRVKDMGIDRPNMVKQEGYQSPPLDGVWLRAPYLHNGSVPNMRELLERPEQRSAKVLARLRRLRPGEHGLRVQRARSRARGLTRSTSRCAATVTRAPVGLRALARREARLDRVSEDEVSQVVATAASTANATWSWQMSRVPLMIASEFRL